MAKQCLNTAEVCSVIKKVCGKTMAQFVGGEVGGQTSLGKTELEE